MRLIVLQAGTLWWREVVRFARQRSRVVGTFLQPLVFWLLIGAGLNASFRPPGAAEINFMQYFYPGIIILALLFTAIFSTVGTIEDRQRGFLQAVLAAPISRSTVIFGQALGGTTLAMAQGIVFLLLTPLAGIHITIAGAAIALLVMMMVSFALTNIGLIIAWRIDSTRAFPAITNLILIPLWLLSGAFFPPEGLPAGLRWAMLVDPLTYPMAALRQSLYMAAPARLGTLPDLGICLAVTAALCGATFFLATRSARSAAAW